MGKVIKPIQLDIKGEFYVLVAIAVMSVPVQWLLAWMVSATVHELGHLLALKLCGITIGSVQLGWFGARIKTAYIVKSEWLCALAGPCAGLLLLSFSRWLPRVAICALFHSVFNLLPIYPLDGGRFVRGLLEIAIPDKHVRWVSTLIGVSVLGVIGFWLSEIIKNGL